jgi:hypothetical protein
MRIYGRRWTTWFLLRSRAASLDLAAVVLYVAAVEVIELYPGKRACKLRRRFDSPYP